jgi:hypothetical protein
MLQQISMMLLASGVFSLPAAAQEIGTHHPDAFLYTAQAALLILGMAFTGYWAYQAFDTPPIKLGDGPALPRYMTQPNQYRLGVIAYVGVCLLVYALIAYFHKELLPLVRALSPELHETIDKSMTDGSLAYPLVVIFSAAIFVTLLKVEKDWNPLFVLRRVVHGWVSIPQFANAVMVMARDELLVPVEARAAVAGDPDTPTLRSAISTRIGEASIGTGPNSATSASGSSTIARRVPITPSSTNPVLPGSSCSRIMRALATLLSRSSEAM